jgi:hypothetical protein
MASESHYGLCYVLICLNQITIPLFLFQLQLSLQEVKLTTETKSRESDGALKAVVIC